MLIKITKEGRISLLKIPSLAEVIIIFFLLHAEVVVAITSFISGTYKVDMFHMLILLYFILYCIDPSVTKRNFFWFAAFISFFAFEKYAYVLNVESFESTGTFAMIMDLTGFSSKSLTNSSQFFYYDPRPRQWILLLVTFV